MNEEYERSRYLQEFLDMIDEMVKSGNMISLKASEIITLEIYDKYLQDHRWFTL